MTSTLTSTVADWFKKIAKNVLKSGEEGVIGVLVDYLAEMQAKAETNMGAMASTMFHGSITDVICSINKGGDKTLIAVFQLLQKDVDERIDQWTGKADLGKSDEELRKMREDLDKEAEEAMKLSAAEA